MNDPNPQAVPAIAPSTVVFLFGETFAARTPAGKHGTRAFATGGVVETEALGQMMLAVELAHMRAIGAISLEPFTRRGFGLRLFETSGIHVRLLDGDLLDGTADRLARAVLGHRKAKEGQASVRAIVTAAVPGSRTPYDGWLRVAISDSVERGYLEEEQSGGVLGFRVKRTLLPHEDRIQSLAEAANGLADEWVAFRKAGPDLAKQLRGVIAKAMEEIADDAREGWNDD